MRCSLASLRLRLAALPACLASQCPARIDARVPACFMSRPRNAAYRSQQGLRASVGASVVFPFAIGCMRRLAHAHAAAHDPAL